MSAKHPPVNLPREPLRFAQILWEELWPGEDPSSHYDPTAQVDPDPTACKGMRVAPAQESEITPNLLDLPSGMT